MDIRHTKDAAARSLAAAAYPPKKLALIHTGAALGLSLVLTVVNYLLAQNIDSAPGLSGIGTRTTLSFLQTVLSLAGSVALPFWEIGILRAALCISRQESATPGTLMEGFRRAGPVLRLLLLELAVTMALIFASTQIASTLYLLTPFSDGLLEQMEIMAESTQGQLIVDEALLSQLLPNMMPIYILSAAVLLVVGIPLFYRFRMARHAIMDDGATGAFAAMKASSRMMRGNRLTLFKLDLSFWWYYGAQLLMALIAYADTLLPMMGISLPLSGDTTFFLFYGIHLLLQLVLAWTSVSYVQTAYAHSYNAFTQQLPKSSLPENKTFV